MLDVLERYPGYYGSAQRRMSGVTERLPGLFPFVSPNLNLLMSSLVTLLSDVAFVVIMRVTAFVMTCTTRLSMDCWDRARSPGRYAPPPLQASNPNMEHRMHATTRTPDSSGEVTPGDKALNPKP